MNSNIECSKREIQHMIMTASAAFVRQRVHRFDSDSANDWYCTVVMRSFLPAKGEARTYFRIKANLSLMGVVESEVATQAGRAAGCRTRNKPKPLSSPSARGNHSLSSSISLHSAAPLGSRGLARDFVRVQISPSPKSLLHLLTRV